MRRVDFCVWRALVVVESVWLVVRMMIMILIRYEREFSQ